jgi:imidazolonepropionase-like amidohydrolase
MRRDFWFGAIAPGKFADLILVDGDPSRRVSDLRRVKTVVKDGVVYQSSELCRAIGMAAHEGK